MQTDQPEKMALLEENHPLPSKRSRRQGSIDRFAGESAARFTSPMLKWWRVVQYWLMNFKSNSPRIKVCGNVTVGQNDNANGTFPPAKCAATMSEHLWRMARRGNDSAAAMIGSSRQLITQPSGNAWGDMAYSRQNPLGERFYQWKKAARTEIK